MDIGREIDERERQGGTERDGGRVGERQQTDRKRKRWRRGEWESEESSFS